MWDMNKRESKLILTLIPIFICKIQWANRRPANRNFLPRIILGADNTFFRSPPGSPSGVSITAVMFARGFVLAVASVELFNEAFIFLRATRFCLFFIIDSHLSTSQLWNQMMALYSVFKSFIRRMPPIDSDLFFRFHHFNFKIVIIRLT